jgi:serine/threonine-protein kinase RsbT
MRSGPDAGDYRTGGELHGLHNLHMGTRFPEGKGTGRREALIKIASFADAIAARNAATKIANELGFSYMSVVMIGLAASEVAQNILKFAVRGSISIFEAAVGERRGIRITVEDVGPGIADLDKAMSPGYSTAGSLGLGLPGCRRIMDQFEVRSVIGRGTLIRMTKWLPRRRRRAASSSSAIPSG